MLPHVCVSQDIDPQVSVGAAALLERAQPDLPLMSSPQFADELYAAVERAEQTDSLTSFVLLRMLGSLAPDNGDSLGRNPAFDAIIGPFLE
jgi:hypothetical protein